MDANGLSLRALAAAKGLPVEFLRELGVTDGRWQHQAAVRIPYRDERDREVAHQYRIALKGDRFRFPAGAKLVPYGLGRLATTNTSAWILLVEGASDCWTLWFHGLPALGLPSATVWHEEWAPYFDGIATIYVIHEGDQGGESLIARLAQSSLRHRVRVVHLSGAKDPSELYLADPERFVERMAAARDEATPLESLAFSAADADDAGARANSGPSGSKSQAEMLIGLAAEAELFHTPTDEPYATIPVGTHRETHPVRSTSFKGWLRRAFWVACGEPVRASALVDAVETLAARAVFDGPSRTVSVRVAAGERALWIDLADPAWRCIEVTSSGWRVVIDAPVRFRRPPTMAPLPEPVRGGSIELVRPFVNLPDEDAFVLLVGFVIAAFRALGPYLVLLLHGEQGSAKSTTARVIRALIDPSTTPLRSEPHEERDLVIGARRNWLLAFDNFSHLPDWLSDALCRISTGGGYETRVLYSDDDEMVFEAQRPQLLTAINEVVTRGDLLDRAITLELSAINERERRSEGDVWRAFERVWPAILGALLDAVVAALRDERSVVVASLPRMADAARWVTAAEPVLGWPAGTFVAAYHRNHQEGHHVAIDSSLLGEPLQRLLVDGDWRGTSGELLAELAVLAGEAATRQRGWPANPRALTSALKRLAPSLRALGIVLERLERTGSSRPILLCKTEGATVTTVTTVTFQRPSHDGHDGHDGPIPAKSPDEVPFQPGAPDDEQLTWMQ